MQLASIFRPHGKFSVKLEGQVLFTEVTGPWNRELVDYWAQQALKLAQQCSAEKPYVAVTQVYESMLCPKDAFERIAKAIDFANHNLPCAGHCLVAGPEVDGRELVRYMYEKIQLGQIFETKEQAIDWARQRLG